MRVGSALTTMPSRLRDKSGHRRNADRVSNAHKRRSKSSAPKEQVKHFGDHAKPKKSGVSWGLAPLFREVRDQKT